MPSDSGVTIEPLDENNYTTWAARVRFLLIKKELWGETTSEVLLNQVKNDKALAEIGLHVKEHHLALVTSCARAYEAWQKLEAIYKSKGQARKIQLRRELNTLKKDVSEPNSKYVARAQSLKSDLAAVGHNVSDEDVAYSILAGLPKEYEIASSILEAQETTLSPHVIMSKLLIFFFFYIDRRPKRTKLPRQTDKGQRDKGTGNKGKIKTGTKSNKEQKQDRQQAQAEQVCQTI